MPIRERQVAVQLSPLEQLRADLSGIEAQAKGDLTQVLHESSPATVEAVEQYLALLKAEHAHEKSAHIATALIGSIRGLSADIKTNGLGSVARRGGTQITNTASSALRALFMTWPGRIALGGTAIAATTETISQNANLTEGFRLFLNNLVKWSNASIPQLDPLSVLTGFANAIGTISIWAGTTTIVVNWENKRQEERLERQRVNLETRAKAQRSIREGTADLNLLADENIAILVGKRDYSVKPLIKKFREIGLDVITYWDEENELFSISPLWVKTENNWTSRENLRKGAIQKTVAVFAEVSKSNDSWLSKRTRQAGEMTEDMLDVEVFDTVQVISAIKDGMSHVPPVISVTNPKRRSSGIISGIGEVNPYGDAVTVEEVARQYNRQRKVINLLDPDTVITNQVAIKAEQLNLPIELLTDSLRAQEYTETLIDHVIPEHNERVKNGGVKAPEIRYRKDGDGINTLTVIFGDDDANSFELTRDYLARIDRIKEENQDEKVGDLLVIVNDPDAIERLPDEIKTGKKYVCVGEIMAKAQFDLFIELVKDGSITLPDRVIEKMKELGYLD